MPTKSSLDQKTSDIVGLINYNFSEIGKIDYNFSVDHNLNDFNYNDFEPPIEHISSKPTKYSRSGIGVIPIKCGMGESIYNTKLSGELAKKWLDVAWTTYHQTLIELLQKAHTNFGHYILFDFHSMPSTSENLNNKIDIVLGLPWEKYSS